MPVVDKEILEKLSPNLPGNWQKGEELMMPSYDGFGLANLTPTVAYWLGAGDLPAPIFGRPILDLTLYLYQKTFFLKTAQS